MSGDAIHIEQLELSAHIGVPDEERGRSQRLTVCLTMWPIGGFDDLGDELANTINYAAVAHTVREFVATRHDKLIETLATGIAGQLLADYAIRAVRVELRKYVIPASDHVAVVITRKREEE